MTIFAPISGIYRPGPPTARITRLVDALGVESGTFSIRARNLSPVGTHQYDLLLESAAEVAALKTFFSTVRGRWKPLWIPSFQEDFKLTAPVAADDEEIIVQDIHYARDVFPTLRRRFLAFVRPDTSFFMRAVTAAESNGDGTETLTLNEALGEAFPIPVSRGMLGYLWYGRLDSDALPIRWFRGHFGLYAEAQISVVDLLSGGGTPGGDPVGDDLPPPCPDGEVVFFEGWTYPTTAAARLEWPSTASNADGAPSGGTAGSFSIEAELELGIGETGIVYHSRPVPVQPGASYNISGTVGCDTAFGEVDNIGVQADGVQVDDGVSDDSSMVPYSTTIVAGDPTLTLRFGVFSRQFPSIGPFVFTVGPITVTRVC